MLTEVAKLDYSSEGESPSGVFYCDQEYLHTPTQAWIDYLKPHVEAVGISDVDLVIEGGVGTSSKLSGIAKGLFPDALFVGTDLSEAYVRKFGRTGKAINQQSLQRIQDANNGEFDVAQACIAGNSLDSDLIADIARKTGSTSPILVSINAMYALFENEVSPWEKKKREDRFGHMQFLQATPYVAQIHLIDNFDVIGFWDDDNEYRHTIITYDFFELERSATALGWNTQRLPIGLLLVNPNS